MSKTSLPSLSLNGMHMQLIWQQKNMVLDFFLVQGGEYSFTITLNHFLLEYDSLLG
jgi:hypothetical protein